MPIYDPWSVVVVPFPFTDRQRAKRRPAVALSPRQFQADHQRTILGMITDARNPSWPSDVPLRDLGSAGLAFASVFRCKLFTLDNSLILRRIGLLSAADRAAAANALRGALAVCRALGRAQAFRSRASSANR
ncbi:MAG: type II toxin-antitoxin system PemK/MazF family toxin [Pseudomonadota bacterium]